MYAAIYSCAERSIRNYRQEGAPLDDPAAMFAWWASRKNMPRSVAAKGLEAVQAAFAAVMGATAPAAPTAALCGAPEDVPGPMDVHDDLPAGAEHELRWLATLAVEARRNLIRAQKSGNPVVQKQALDSYLKITEGLRKFDNQVDQNRRDGAEVVTRAQIENVLFGVIAWTYRGIESFINESCLRIAECDAPQEVYIIVPIAFGTVWLPPLMPAWRAKRTRPAGCATRWSRPYETRPPACATFPFPLKPNPKS